MKGIVVVENKFMRVLFYFVSICLFLGCSTYKQIDIQVINLTNQTFYQGVENKLTVLGIDHLDSSTITTDNGKIKYYQANEYLYVPERPGSTFLKIKVSKMYTKEQYALIVQTPNPIPYLIFVERDYTDI